MGPVRTVREWDAILADVSDVSDDGEAPMFQQLPEGLDHDHAPPEPSHVVDGAARCIQRWQRGRAAARAKGT